MILTQYYEECLSQAGYLIGDERSATAVIVDPLRDVDQYLDAASELGLTIVGVILTHFHADFLAGHLELAAATGAWIGIGERGVAEFDARLLADGERIELGTTVLEIMATPGHTPESISILVFEHAGDRVAHGVLTGDSLFVGDVGRVDLQASFGADALELAKAQYDTVQRRFMALPDAVRVFPAHGPGSACGKNISEDTESTIGRERMTNPACAPMSETDFVAMITTGQVPAPAYFVKDAALNRELHDLFSPEHPLDAIDEQRLDRLRSEGAVLLDCRDVETFIAAHLPGALNVPLNGRFAETAGMFLEPGTSSIVIVTPLGQQDLARRKLARVGLDQVRGYLPLELMATLPLVAGERFDPQEFDAELRGDAAPVLIDVRGPGEYEAGAIPGAINLPLAELARRLAEISSADRVLVNCAGGWRSSVATSYLNSNGIAAADLRGGYHLWEIAS